MAYSQQEVIEILMKVTADNKAVAQVRNELAGLKKESSSGFTVGGIPAAKDVAASGAAIRNDLTPNVRQATESYNQLSASVMASRAAIVGSGLAAAEFVRQSAAMAERARDFRFLAAEVGLSTTQLRLHRAVFDQVGISAEQTDRGLGRFSQNMLHLRRGWGEFYTYVTNSAPRLFEQLRSASTTQDQLSRAMSYLQEIPDIQRRAIVATHMFGSDIFARLGELSPQQLQDAFRRAGVALGGLSQDFQKANDEFASEIATFKQHLDRLGVYVQERAAILGARTLGPVNRQISAFDKMMRGEPLGDEDVNPVTRGIGSFSRRVVGAPQLQSFDAAPRRGAWGSFLNGLFGANPEAADWGQDIPTPIPTPAPVPGARPTPIPLPPTDRSAFPFGAGVDQWQRGQMEANRRAIEEALRARPDDPSLLEQKRLNDEMLRRMSESVEKGARAGIKDALTLAKASAPAGKWDDLTASALGFGGTGGGSPGFGFGGPGGFAGPVGVMPSPSGRGMGGPLPGGTGAPVSRDMEQRARQFYGALREQGFTHEQSVALLGHARQESGIHPNNPNRGEGATGAIHWRLDRLSNLQRFAAERGLPWDDLRTQAAFLRHEMTQGSEQRAGRGFLAARTVDEASAALRPYIRFGDRSDGTRLGYARQFDGMMQRPPGADAPGNNGEVDPLGGQGRIKSNFGLRWGRMHAGIDIAAPTGTPVRATTTGTVEHAGPRGAYGNLVIIRGADGSTRYAHLNDVGVQPGQQVTAGDVIGSVGSTGRSTGPHLHYERRDALGRAMDPREYIDAARAPRNPWDRQPMADWGAGSPPPDQQSRVAPDSRAVLGEATRAGMTSLSVNGTASIDLTLNGFPATAQADAKTSGIFSKVELRRGSSRARANETA